MKSEVKINYLININGFCPKILLRRCWCIVSTNRITKILTTNLHWPNTNKNLLIWCADYTNARWKICLRCENRNGWSSLQEEGKALRFCHSITNYSFVAPLETKIECRWEAWTFFLSGHKWQRGRSYRKIRESAYAHRNKNFIYV